MAMTGVINGFPMVSFRLVLFLRRTPDKGKGQKQDLLYASQ